MDQAGWSFIQEPHGDLYYHVAAYLNGNKRGYLGHQNGNIVLMQRTGPATTVMGRGGTEYINKFLSATIPSYAEDEEAGEYDAIGRGFPNLFN